jgi:rare lipoprotein A
VRLARGLASPLGFAAAAGLTACFSTPPKPHVSGPSSAPPPSLAAPTPPDSVPDAVPRFEPRSRNGNPPFYDVFGKRYYVLSSGIGYWERGVASWYGPGFHKERTSTGEPYDMYGMTAAHKTLPLPIYVRVTNLQNGRSVVVRVNDRGPFVGNRIIDLSYTAAAKLDMLRNGTAMVEVRAVDPSAPPPVITASAGIGPSAVPAVTGPTAPAAPATPTASIEPVASAAEPPAAGLGVISSAVAAPAAPAVEPGGSAHIAPALFVQAGAFADPANAERLAEKLRGGSFGKVFVRDDQIAGRRMFRVRIGPVPDVAEFDRVVAALERAGISDAHLALD